MTNGFARTELLLLFVSSDTSLFVCLRMYSDVLGGGQGAVARILAHYLVLYNAPPDTLGLPRKNRGDIPQGKDGNEDHDDDDRPEVDYEPEIPDKQLEGEI